VSKAISERRLAKAGRRLAKLRSLPGRCPVGESGGLWFNARFNRAGRSMVSARENKRRERQQKSVLV